MHPAQQLVSNTLVAVLGSLAGHTHIKLEGNRLAETSVLVLTLDEATSASSDPVPWDVLGSPPQPTKALRDMAVQAAERLGVAQAEQVKRRAAELLREPAARERDQPESLIVTDPWIY